MGDAAGQHAQALELLGVQHLGLQRRRSSSARVRSVMSARHNKSMSWPAPRMRAVEPSNITSWARCSRVRSFDT